MSLSRLHLRLAGTGDDSVAAEAVLAVKRGTGTNELALSLQAQDDGRRLAVSCCAAQGMGLDINGGGDWQRDTDTLSARLSLNSAAQAPWQDLVAELSGVDKQLLAALADPLAVETTLRGKTQGELNLDIDRLQAGAIAGQGKITANINDWLAGASPDKAETLKTRLNLTTENLAPLGVGVSGPLAVNLEADGNMRTAQISLNLSSTELETGAGRLEQLTALLSGAFKMDAHAAWKPPASSKPAPPQAPAARPT